MFINSNIRVTANQTYSVGNGPSISIRKLSFAGVCGNMRVTTKLQTINLYSRMLVRLFTIESLSSTHLRSIDMVTEDKLEQKVLHFHKDYEAMVGKFMFLWPSPAKYKIPHKVTCQIHRMACHFECIKSVSDNFQQKLKFHVK